MLRCTKKVGGFLVLSILAILLLTSNVSFARFGAADIQGTWDLKLKVTFTNVNWAGKPASSEFNDTATMEITQFVNVGSGSPVRVRMSGATNPLLNDIIIPPPIFWGEGIVNPAASLGAGKDHMVAIDCDSAVDNFAGQIIVHRIYRVRDMGFTRMKGTLMIVDNTDGEEAGIIATFTAERLDTDDPGVNACF